MELFLWNEGKNLKLINERGISFEEIVEAIKSDKIIEVVEHPNQTKYPNQEIYLIYYNEYYYMVPFVEDKNGCRFLKTIIPSRKAKKKFKKEE